METLHMITSAGERERERKELQFTEQRNGNKRNVVGD